MERRLRALLPGGRAWLRAWLARPVLTIVLLLVIGLGIGSTTATLGIVYGLLLRPLPFAAPEELVVVKTRSSLLRGSARDVSLPDLDDLRREARLTTSMAAFQPRRFGLIEGATARAVEYARVTPGFFETLGVAPLLGATFRPEDDLPGADADKAVLSYPLWRDRFGSDPSIVGRTLRTSVTTLLVVGVMPQGFGYPAGAELWVPVQSLLQVRGLERQKQRQDRTYQVVARLSRGVALPQADSELQAIARELAKSHPVTNEGMEPFLVPLRDAELGDAPDYLQLLSGAVSLVLLVSAANVTTLLLVRLAARRKELAVRSALGASASHLLLDQVLECVALASLGGLLGVVLAEVLVRALPRALGPRLPPWMSIGLDPPVLVAGVAVMILTGIAVGLVSGIVGSRVSLDQVLRQGSRGASAAGRVKRGLVVAEVALAAVVLVSAGLLLRSLERLGRVSLGFDPDRLITVQLSPFVPGEERERIRRSTAYFERIVARLLEIPGVLAVGGTDKFPFDGVYAARPTQSVEAKGDLETDVVHRAPAGFIDVTPGYFEAMRIPLLEGRPFREDDDLRAPWVIILSQRAAATLFPGRSPLGRQVRINTAGVVDPWAMVVGVVGNVKYRATEGDEALEFYYPYKQYGLSTTRLVLRLEGARPGIDGEIRRVVRSVDAETPVEDVRSMDDLIGETLWQRRAWSSLLSAFAVTALVLAVLGLYGMLAFSVAERTREIGTRMALGSPPWKVAALVARESLSLVARGLALGLVSACAAARAMGSLLFGVPWFDPLTFVLVGLVLALAGVGAACLPAARAVRVDPLVALRAD